MQPRHYIQVTTLCFTKYLNLNMSQTTFPISGNGKTIFPVIHTKKFAVILNLSFPPLLHINPKNNLVGFNFKIDPECNYFSPCPLMQPWSKPHDPTQDYYTSLLTGVPALCPVHSIFNAACRVSLF